MLVDLHQILSDLPVSVTTHISQCTSCHEWVRVHQVQILARDKQATCGEQWWHIQATKSFTIIQASTCCTCVRGSYM